MPQPKEPPPLPESKPAHYYIGLRGEQKGPFSVKIISQMILDKTITKETLVWGQGMPEWIQAGEADGLKEMFNLIPPPLPE
jgi:hypothetical protein